jgi:maltooligosyltrehalose synthase
MPTGSNTTSGINIVNDFVVIHIFGENPACIVIKNREVANTYKNYFDIIWNSSTKLEE